MHSILLAVSNVPTTTEWSFGVASVMILCNAFAFVNGRFAIKNPGQGPKLPAGGGKPDVLKNFGIAELLATMSFGHILGAGLILGLSSAGAL